jgi:hypothetical protein
MLRHLFALVFFLGLGSGASQAQENFIAKKDLLPEWLVFTSNQYSDFDKADQPVRTIYFSTQPSSFRGDYLVVTAREEFSIFLNGKLESCLSMTERVLLFHWIACKKYSRKIRIFFLYTVRKT